MFQTKNKPNKSNHLGKINSNKYKYIFYYCFKTICLKLCHIHFIKTNTLFVMVHLILLMYKIEKNMLYIILQNVCSTYSLTGI